jgi:uncharacterized protein (DUF1778 family)
MPRPIVEENNRMSLRIRSSEKAILMRAASLRSTGLTDFVKQHSLKAAVQIIEESERLKLSARDSQKVLALLENPPAPNAKLKAAAKALSKQR